MNPQPAPFAKPVRRSAMQGATRNIRNAVASWHGRTFRVQHDHDLLSILQVLKPHVAHLASHSPHAERLYANVTAELAKRGLLSC